MTAFKKAVIAGLDPAIWRQPERDARVKPGHDGVVGEAQ